MSWQNEVTGAVLILVQLSGFQVCRVEALWVHHGAGDVPEDAEIAWGEPEVVAKTGYAITDNMAWRCNPNRPDVVPFERVKDVVAVLV